MRDGDGKKYEEERLQKNEEQMLLWFPFVIQIRELGRKKSRGVKERKAEIRGGSAWNFWWSEPL